MNAIESFDWDAAHEMYERMDWRWFGSCNIPSAADLKNLAYYLLKKCIKHECNHYSSGRIVIEINNGNVAVYIGMQSHSSIETFKDIVEELTMENALE